MSGWNENIGQIRDSIAVLREQLKSEEPKDRLDAVGKIVQCIDFMKQSNMGWLSLLTNPSIVNRLDEEALRDEYLYTDGTPGVIGAGWTEPSSAPNLDVCAKIHV
jgi:hypothetical protein